ncbi:hypothetical protein KKF61_02800 [Patescibacteria group bacterium]|nr:hypothetical protein [Patescibacteria group bacterium]
MAPSSGLTEELDKCPNCDCQTPASICDACGNSDAGCVDYVFDFHKACHTCPVSLALCQGVCLECKQPLPS